MAHFKPGCIVPLALIAGGFLLWKKSTQVVQVPTSGALPGMGDLDGFKKRFKKATKIARKVSPSAWVADKTKGIVSTVIKDPGNIKEIVSKVSRIDPMAAAFHKVAQKSPLLRRSKLVKAINRTGQKDTQQPEPGQAVEYTDINGASITEAQYNAIMAAVNSGQPIQMGDMWAMPDGYMLTAAQYAARYPGTSSPPLISDPPGRGDGTSYTNIYEPSGQAPLISDPPGRGDGRSARAARNDPASGGGSSYSLPPEAPQGSQQYVASPADLAPAAVAAKKFNPLLAIGALIAVPVVMGLTGGK